MLFYGHLLTEGFLIHELVAILTIMDPQLTMPTSKKSKNHLIFPDGTAPLPKDMHIEGIDGALKLEHALDKMVADLPINLAQRVELNQAFHDSGL